MTLNPRIAALFAVGVCLAGFALKNASGQEGRAGPVVYAAPGGAPGNRGTADNPIDLASALKPGRIRPGTTLMLRGGTYTGPFRSDLTGTASALVTMRSAPGETAVITSTVGQGDGGALNVFGAWTIYRDFEVTNSSQDRGYQKGFRPMGLNIEAPHSKFINLVVHDAGHGFGFWKEAVDSELYGNIIFNNGTENTSTDMRHGHAIYTQNTDGEKLIRDNVMFDEFGWGISGYPGPGGVTGYHIEGNVAFNNGLASHLRQHYNNLMVSGHTPFKTDKVTMVNNFTYYPPNQDIIGRFTDANVCLGCSDPELNGEATITGNFFVNGSPVILANGWQRLQISNNTIIGPGTLISVQRPNGAGKASYEIDQNKYFGGKSDGAFVVDGKSLNANAWKGQIGSDAGSTFSGQMRTGVDVFVRPNQYEPGRAHVIVYNWDRRPQVEADISQALRAGMRYRIYNVQNLSQAVVEGAFDGKPVRLPMAGARVAAVAGHGGGTNAEAMATGPEFNVFLVKPVEDAPALPTVTSTYGASQLASPIPPQLRPFEGAYASPDGKARAQITASPEGLSIRIQSEPNQPQYALTQVNGARFRLAGTPDGFFCDFSVQGNRVEGITLIRGPLPKVFLTKQ